MAGELWRSYYQIGLESTPNTTVAATRRMYFNVDGSGFKRERAPRAHRFATASRDNVRALTLGSTEVSGTVAMPMSADEIIELLLMGINGSTTPTGSSPYVWTFTPGTTLAPATIEEHDGARGWDVGGCYVDKLKISGSVSEGCTVEADIFGMSKTQATLTSGLGEATPTFIEGWETRLYVDDHEATPGTTQKTGTLLNWDITIENGLGRKYFAANTLDAGAITTGELSVSAKLTYEASSTEAASEYTNWDGETLRLVRLYFGGNELISGSDYLYVAIDLPGGWDAFDLTGSADGTRTYELGLQYVYDPTNAFGLQIIAQNDRSAAWGDR